MYEYKHNHIFEESDQRKNKHAHLLAIWKLTPPSCKL